MNKKDNAIGIDLGLKEFAITSNGEKITNPRVLKKYEKKIARLQRSLARKEKSSSNWNKAKSISDVSWSKFVEYLEYKAEWYGRDQVKIDTFFASSQLCNNCGYKNKEVKDLKIQKAS